MEIDRLQLDTRVQVITPENIAFQYRVAGPFLRLPAYLIDMLIRVGICGISWIAFMIGFGASGLPGWGFGIWLILVFFCVFF